MAPMFFFLSKLLPGLLFPYPLFLILCALALWRLPAGRFRRIFGIVFVSVFLASTYASASLLLGSLERRYPTLRTAEAEKADAIVVLSGMVTPSTRPVDRPQFNDAVERILAGKDLLRAGKAPVLLISGGSGLLSNIGRPESIVLKEWLISEGIPENRIIAESESRNTGENAVESARIAKEKGIRKIILVTSAFHMPRSVLCFEKQGFEVQPFPVARYLVDEFPGMEAFFPAPAGMTLSTIALKEYVGIVMYRLKGYL